MTKHFCEVRTKFGLYGSAIWQVTEDEDGHFWADNSEYSTQVNYCPQCGAKAPTAAEPDVDPSEGLDLSEES